MGLISPGAENLLDFLESLELRQGPQGPALVASGKASAHGSCKRAFLDSSPVDAVAKAWWGVGSGTGGFLSSADMDLGVLLESPQGSQSSS